MVSAFRASVELADPPRLFCTQLEELLSKLSRCATPGNVTSATLDCLPDLFEVYNCGLVVWDETLRVTYRESIGMSDEHCEEWEEVWIPRDQVFRRVIERRIPTHHLVAYSEADWVRDPIYTDFARKIGARQYMSAPLYGADGRVTGIINMCRHEHEETFGDTELHLVGVIAGYLSATLARTRDVEETAFPPADLAIRELEVARLAASGHNNLSIALHLGIARETVKKTLSRVYDKLHVSGRAQMAATLARGGLL